MLIPVQKLKYSTIIYANVLDVFNHGNHLITGISGSDRGWDGRNISNLFSANSSSSAVKKYERRVENIIRKQHSALFSLKKYFA